MASEERFEEQQNTNDEMQATLDNLLAELECPVCFETCLPPIFMCENGHNVCSNCKQQVVQCPTCRTLGTPAYRNLFAETAVEQITVACKYKEAGCKNVATKFKLSAHEIDCDFRYECLNCQEHIGDLKRLNVHFATIHPSLYSKSNVWEGVLPAEPGTYIRQFSCCDVLFRCGIRSIGDNLCLYVRYMGPREDADKYVCWMKFVSPDGKFKCSYEVQCHDTSVEFVENDVVIVTTKIFQRLRMQNGTVRCKIVIRKAE